GLGLGSFLKTGQMLEVFGAQRAAPLVALGRLVLGRYDEKVQAAAGHPVDHALPLLPGPWAAVKSLEDAAPLEAVGGRRRREERQREQEGESHLRSSPQAARRISAAAGPMEFVSS